MWPHELIIMIDQLETIIFKNWLSPKALYSLGVFRKPRVDFHAIC
jgi:hypothetical protein